MRKGRASLPTEAEKIYDAGLPNLTTIHTEAYVTAFLNRNRILSIFDSLELERRDPVVMARSVYKILTMFRRNRAKYLYIPNATLGGDSDCTVLLTLNDIALRITNEKYIFIPQCVVESGRGADKDIAGVTVDDFVKKTGVKVRLLRKINTKFANNRLYRNGSLQNYVNDYVRNPLVRHYETFPLSA